MKSYVGNNLAISAQGASKPSRVIRGLTPLWSRLGMDWYARQSPVLNIWTGVAFGNGVFVAVAQSFFGPPNATRIMTSHDGATWTERVGPASNLGYSSVLFGNGVFVALGSIDSTNTAIAAVSADGISWTQHNLTGVQSSTFAAFGNGVFAAMCALSGGSQRAIFTSTNGTSWSIAAGTTFGISGTSGFLHFANGRFFTTGSTSESNANGTSRNLSSLDGISWSSAPMTEPPAARFIRQCVFAGGFHYGLVLGASPGFWRSQDTTTWEQIGSLPSFNFQSLLHVDGLFVVGETSSAATNRTRIYTSPDGVNWTPQVGAPRNIPARRLASGNGVLVAVGDDGPFRAMSSRVSPELSIQATELPRVISGQSQETVVVKDATYLRSSNATLATDYIVSPRFGSTLATDVTITSGSTSVLSNPNQSGLMSWAANGTSTITATDTRGLTASLILQARTYSNGFADEFQFYNNGTAAKSASDAIDGALGADKQKAIFSTKDHATQTYARNSSCWIHGRHDLTCLSVWNSSSGTSQCGTLISPRHVVWAAHYPLPVGTTFRWIRADGVVVSGTVSAKSRPANYSPYYPDFEIGLLSADIGSGISFARVLPDGWRSKFPSVSLRSPVPACVVDQDENALVADWYLDGTQYVNMQRPSIQARLDYHESLVTGDSGHPCFLLLEGVQQPVLLTVWTYGGAGSGTSVAENKSVINSMMTSLGGGYQLTPVDLSGFPSY